jgi:hypothetical protein
MASSKTFFVSSLKRCFSLSSGSRDKGLFACFFERFERELPFLLLYVGILSYAISSFKMASSVLSTRASSIILDVFIEGWVGRGF